MQANVIGRVRNTHLSKTQALLPLYEAIINSVDAIEDIHSDPSNGRIDVKIIRHKGLQLENGQSGDQRHHDPIYAFEITDNGIGFTDANFQAFNEADTQIKAQRGGKGVGRFLWLKAFESVDVDSTFQRGGDSVHRSFQFSLATDGGVTDHDLKQQSGTGEIRTLVKLTNFKTEYEQNAPRNAHIIAHRIVEHCLEYFLLSRMPIVTLIDEAEEQEILLDDVYDRLVSNTSREAVEIDGNRFDIAHFMLHAHSDLKHHVSYCADRRVVLSEKIGGRIANLPTTLLESDEVAPAVYAGYVSSEYFNRRVNQQRTGFDTMPEGGLTIPGELAWPQVEDGVLSAAKRFLEPYTEKVRSEKDERIREFVSSNAPEYRHIVKNHADKLEAIPPDVSDDSLEQRLHEISRQVEGALKQEASQFLDNGLLSDEEQTPEAQLEQFSRWWQEYNDAGKANLAKYIVHRKLALVILEKALGLQDTGKYSREEVIHKIVFPLRKTSDDITYDQHNLWIIDEKLAYHAYLASDLALRKVEVLDSESTARPDLLMFFDSAIAVVDDEAPYNSGIVIFEFKRPMRDDYDEENNPIQQVLQYVKDIRAGKAITKNGRPIPVQDRTPFYCYVICDLTPKLSDQAKFAGLQATPDNWGYFGYNPAIGAYIEVVSFDKLVSDANKRNRVLFEKLNLPDTLYSSSSM